MDINHLFLFIIRNSNFPSDHNILFICKVEDLGNQKKVFPKKTESQIQRKRREINKRKSKNRCKSGSRSRSYDEKSNNNN